MAKNGTTVRLWRRSLIVLMIILVVGFGMVTARLFYLQTYMADELQQKAVDQQLADTTISAKRGSIYDRNGKVLAQSATVWKIVIAPINLKSDEERHIVANGLAKILDLDVDEVYQKTLKKSYYIEIKRKVDTDIRDQVVEFAQKISEENGIKAAINTIEDYKRSYPYNQFAGSVLGFVGSDGQGLEGLESQYDEYLTGKPGRLITAQNAVGTDMPFQYEQKVEAQDGYNLKTTIDENIQRIMEKYVDQAIVENKVANRGCAIMVDVKTGAVLGMAVEGSFDPNEPFEIADEAVKKAIEKLPENEQDEAYSNALAKQWRNKAVSDTYVPGSVFKPIVTAAVLSEKVVDDSTRFTCNGSYAPFEGSKPLGCHQHSGHGTQNLLQALCNSCNPAYMQMGNLLGAENYYQYYVAFGFSEKTGIDLPGESSDAFFDRDNTPGKMTRTDLAVASFGQNFQVTPLQMVMALAAIANDGKLMQPYVVSQITDADGNVVKSFEPTVKRQVISENIADQICEMLGYNAVNGGAKNGYVAGYRIGGKTGTSETHRDYNDDNTDDYIASFAGIAPYDDPQVALLCFFDTPTGDSYYGTSVAGPCFRNIMSEVLPYLGVERKYSDEEIANLSTTASSYVGMTTDKASAKATEDELKPIIKGSGSKVVAQSPPAYSSVPKEGTVVLYTDDSAETDTVTVPDFTNLTLSQANSAATESGLNITISGTFTTDDSVTVASQTIESGKEVPRGTVITVVFEQKNGIM